MFIKSKIQFFESKSQQNMHVVYIFLRCLSSQRYNFLKANHNYKTDAICSILVVYQVKDTIFWKQITTMLILLPYYQGCLSSQRYNFLKANHNTLSLALVLCVLFIKSKIQFFESKSQLIWFVSLPSFCCLSSQRYNFLKANHNPRHIFALF